MYSASYTSDATAMYNPFKEQYADGQSNVESDTVRRKFTAYGSASIVMITDINPWLKVVMQSENLKLASMSETRPR